MEWRLIGALMFAVLLADSGSSVASFRAKTKTLLEVTGQVGDIRDKSVSGDAVEKYLDALSFPARGEGLKPGSRVPVKSCHGCPDYHPLEIVAELGAIELAPADLRKGGMIVALIRNDSWDFTKEHKDLDIRWRTDKAYLWIAAGATNDTTFPAALISIPWFGARKELIKGTVHYRADTGHYKAGDARWGHQHPPAGKVGKYDFHLGTWFACLQGCCQFMEDPGP
jgi:hypothetical protein